jgi:hypothetical protein
LFSSKKSTVSAWDPPLNEKPPTGENARVFGAGVSARSVCIDKLSVEEVLSDFLVEHDASKRVPHNMNKKSFISFLILSFCLY